MGDQTPSRLRQLADDCEERARLSRNSNGRSLYGLAARECRLARLVHDGRQRETLAAMTQLAQVARWYDGEQIGDASVRSMLDNRALAPIDVEINRRPPADNISVDRPAAIPPGALNARQLAGLHGVTERTARRTIERGVRRGLPGFYREGCHWFAERLAFSGLRAGVSELCPNAAAVAYCDRSHTGRR